MMIFNSSVFVLILQTFFLSCIFILSSSTAHRSNFHCPKSIKESLEDPSNFHCLKSIKESLEDPLKRLTWTFPNDTKDSIKDSLNACKLEGVSFSSHKDGRINSIKLSNMGLKGGFPNITENCTTIRELDLSGNNLSDPLPFDLCEKLPNLVSLNLSHNKFSGKIPPTIADCKCLNSLFLDHNNLTGHIPSQITKLEELKNFSVSNNMLSGHVPNFTFRNFPEESYANNSGLCGGPLGPCGGPLEPCGGPLERRGWHMWSKFKQGFVVGFLVFAVSNVVFLIGFEW